MPYGKSATGDLRLLGNGETGRIATAAFAYINGLLASNDFDLGAFWTLNGGGSAIAENVAFDGPMPVGGYKTFLATGTASTDFLSQNVATFPVSPLQTTIVDGQIYILAPFVASPSRECKLLLRFNDAGQGIEFSVAVDPTNGQIISQSLTGFGGIVVDPAQSINRVDIQSFNQGVYTAFRINMRLLTAQVPGCTNIDFEFTPNNNAGVGTDTIISCAQLAIVPYTTAEGPSEPLTYDTLVYDWPAYIPTSAAQVKTSPGVFPQNITGANGVIDAVNALQDPYTIDLYKDYGRFITPNSAGVVSLAAAQIDQMQAGWCCYIGIFANGADSWQISIPAGAQLQLGNTLPIFNGPQTLFINDFDLSVLLYALVLTDPTVPTWALLPVSQDTTAAAANRYFLAPDSTGNPYTLVLPPEVNLILVNGAGGGGGGGGAQNAANSGGGGGGASGDVELHLQVLVSPGETLTINVAPGGAGGAAGVAGGLPASATTITGSVSGLLLTLPGPATAAAAGLAGGFAGQGGTATNGTTTPGAMNGQGGSFLPPGAAALAGLGGRGGGNIAGGQPGIANLAGPNKGIGGVGDNKGIRGAGGDGGSNVATPAGMDGADGFIEIFW